MEQSSRIVKQKRSKNKRTFKNILENISPIDTTKQDRIKKQVSIPTSSITTVPKDVSTNISPLNSQNSPIQFRPNQEISDENVVSDRTTRTGSRINPFKIYKPATDAAKKYIKCRKRTIICSVILSFVIALVVSGIIAVSVGK